MASTKSGYRTIQSENFDPIEADEDEAVAKGSHGKFIGLVVLAVVAAGSVGTLFALIS
jgi:hypothetical protein